MKKLPDLEALPDEAPVVEYEGQEWIVAPYATTDDGQMARVEDGFVRLDAGAARGIALRRLLASLDSAPSQAVWDVLRVAMVRGS